MCDCFSTGVIFKLILGPYNQGNRITGGRISEGLLYVNCNIMSMVLDNAFLTVATISLTVHVWGWGNLVTLRLMGSIN